MEKIISPHVWALNTLDEDGLWVKGYEAILYGVKGVWLKNVKDQRHNPLTKRASLPALYHVRFRACSRQVRPDLLTINFYRYT
jgi:hypothetical protein